MNKQYVVLVHGIRDHAEWQRLIAPLLERVPGVRIKSLKYDRFDLLSFLLPGPIRRSPVDRIRRTIVPIISDASKEGAEVTVIAHSYGTYIMARILQEERHLHIGNLLLCGSVIPRDYDWAASRKQVRGSIINDYGVLDVWPAVAKSVTWGYGNTGTYGFGGNEVIDRAHDFGHSGFFESKFVVPYWADFLGRRAKRKSKSVLRSPWWFAIFVVPWRWVLWPLLVMAIVAGAAYALGWRLFYPAAIVTFAEQQSVDAEIRAANRLLRIVDMQQHNNSVFKIGFPSMLPKRRVWCDSFSLVEGQTNLASAETKLMLVRTGRYLELLADPGCSKRHQGTCDDVVVRLSRPGIGTSEFAKDDNAKRFYRFEEERGNRLDIFRIKGPAILPSGNEYMTEILLCGRFNEAGAGMGQIHWEFEPGNCQPAKLERTLARVRPD